MKVFISWSGELSRKLGEILRTWLPGTLQSVKPYFTPEDIEKGARWNTEIAKQLNESSIGIFCLTAESLNSSWLMFEAGALSKHIDRSHICPILFGIDNADLKGPLVQFQSTLFHKDDMLKLIHTVNNCCKENRLEKDVLESVFETWWPKLDTEVTNAIKTHREEGSGSKQQSALAVRPDRELMEEILELVRLVSTNTKLGSEKLKDEDEQRSQGKIERIVERIIERPKHRRLSNSHASVTHQFSVAGHEGTITVGLYDDGSPGELFIRMAKEGSTAGGIMNALASSVTIGLQYGVPLKTFIDIFRHHRFEPSGMTSNKELPFAKSIVDYIFAWMGCQFIPGYREINIPQRIYKKDSEGSSKEDGKKSKKNTGST